MKKFVSRISIDRRKLEKLLKEVQLKPTPFFNSLYGQSHGHYLMTQFLSGEEVVSINKYKEFQGKTWDMYGILPELISIRKTKSPRS